MIIRMKKMAALLMVLVMTASMVVVFGSAEVNAAGKSYKMPTGLKTYEYVNGKWKKTNDRTYKYDSKGNMSNWDGTALKIQYKNSKLKKVTCKSNVNNWDQCNTTKVYDSKGRVTEIAYLFPEIFNVTSKYKYDNKGFITSLTKDTAGEIDGKELYRIKYYSNGMPKQITKTYKNIDKSELGRYKNLATTKVIETYNKNGYYTSCKIYKGKKLYQSYTVSYKMSGNQVKSAVENFKIRDGKKSNYKWKHVYTYGKAKTSSKKQYAAIISMTHGSLLFQTVGDNSAVGWCRIAP